MRCPVSVHTSVYTTRSSPASCGPPAYRVSPTNVAVPRLLGLGSPLPHLYGDWAHPGHICTGTGLAPAHICTGTGCGDSEAAARGSADRRMRAVDSAQEGACGAGVAAKAVDEVRVGRAVLEGKPKQTKKSTQTSKQADCPVGWLMAEEPAACARAHSSGGASAAQSQRYPPYALAQGRSEARPWHGPTAPVVPARNGT